LPILEAAAANPLSEVQVWTGAAIVAATTSDHDSFQRLSAEWRK
jgi:hypothetical protein